MNVSILSDRAVFEISRNTNTGRIEFLKVFLPVDGVIGGCPLEISRTNLIKDIKDGKAVYTAVNKGAEWIRGEDVRVTSAGYLRADMNDTTEDNLGTLPEYHKLFA